MKSKNMKPVYKKVKCWFGFHSPKEIGRAIYPYDTSKMILAMGCRDCGKKLETGYLVDKELLENPLAIFKD